MVDRDALATTLTAAWSAHALMRAVERWGFCPTVAEASQIADDIRAGTAGRRAMLLRRDVGGQGCDMWLVTVRGQSVTVIWAAQSDSGVFGPGKVVTVHPVGRPGSIRGIDTSRLRWTSEDGKASRGRWQRRQARQAHA